MDSAPAQTDPPPPAFDGFAFATVIIKPFRLDPVLEALRPFHLISVTASEVRGYGRQKGHLELYRGSEYAISFIPKVKLEIVAPALELEEVLNAVQAAARTGRIGDGKVFIQHLEGVRADETAPG